MFVTITTRHVTSSGKIDRTIGKFPKADCQVAVRCGALLRTVMSIIFDGRLRNYLFFASGGQRLLCEQKSLQL